MPPGGPFTAPSRRSSAYDPSAEELDAIFDALKGGMDNNGYTYEQLLNAPAQMGDKYADIALAADWVRCVALPEDNVENSLRFHSDDAQTPSAAVTQIMPYAFAWQAQPGQTNAVVGPSDSGVFLFDDHPGCIACFTDCNAGRQFWSYDWTWNGNKTLYWDQYGRIRVNKAMHDNNPTTNWDPHGLFLYCQADQLDIRYIWNDVRPGALTPANADGNTKYLIRFPGITTWGSLGASVQVFVVNIYRYFNGNPRLCLKVPITPTSAPIVGTGPDAMATITVTLNNNDVDSPSTGQFPTQSDYYTMQLSTVATVADVPLVNTYVLSGMQVNQSGYCAVLRHVAIQDMESMINIWSDRGRINALSARITDISMLQYVNGLCCGGVIQAGNSWYQYFQNGLAFGRSFFDKLSKVPNVKPIPLEAGGYIFTRSAGVLSDLQWSPWVTWDGESKTAVDVKVPLTTDRPVRFMACYAANEFATSANGGGANCYLTLACMIEWVPPVSWFPVERSPYTRDSIGHAKDIIGRFPDFTENDTHWEQFLDIAANTAKFGAPVLRALVDSGTERFKKYLGPKLAGGLRTVGQKAISAAVGYANRKRKPR